MITLPNEFTACETYRGFVETYRGFVIATRCGSYVAFRDGERFVDPNGVGYRRDSREQIRRSIDIWLDQGVVA